MVNLFHIIQKLQPYWFASQKEALVSTQGKWHVWTQTAFLSTALLCVCGSRKDRHKREAKSHTREILECSLEKKIRVWTYTSNWLLGGKCWEICFVLLNCVYFCDCKQWRRGSYMREIVIVSLFTNILCTWNHFHCGLNKTTDITWSAIAVLHILTLHQNYLVS